MTKALKEQESQDMKSKDRSFDKMVGCKLRAVICNIAEDFERGSYPNLSINTINIKCNLVFFSSFVITVS